VQHSQKGAIIALSDKMARGGPSLASPNIHPWLLHMQRIKKISLAALGLASIH